MNMKKTQILFTVGLTSLVLSVIFILITIISPKKTETIIIKEQNTPVEFSGPVNTNNYFDFSSASEKATKAFLKPLEFAFETLLEITDNSCIAEDIPDLIIENINYELVYKIKFFTKNVDVNAIRGIVWNNIK